MVSSALCFRYSLLAVGTCIGVTKVLADGLNPFIAPSAGQVIPVGQPFEIRWTPGTPGPVFIALEVNANHGTGNISNSTPNNGSYTWTPNPISAVDNGGQGYFLQICDLITRDCTYTFSGRFSLVNSTSATSSSTSVGCDTLVRANAYSYQALMLTCYASSSVLPSPSVSSTTTSSTTSVSPTVSSPVASTSPPAPTPNRSDGLSNGAQVVIGAVVSVLATAALLVGGYFILRRRRRTEAAKKEQGLSREYTKPELSGDSIRKDDWRGGMNGYGSRNAYELSSSEQAQVLELATE